MLRSESASVQTLRGTVEALEQEKAKLQERVQRLEKDGPPGPNVNTSSGDGGLISWQQLIGFTLTSFLCEVEINFVCSCSPGDAVLEQLREDKETAESQVSFSLHPVISHVVG